MSDPVKQETADGLLEAIAECNHDLELIYSNMVFMDDMKTPMSWPYEYLEEDHLQIRKAIQDLTDAAWAEYDEMEKKRDEYLQRLLKMAKKTQPCDTAPGKQE